MKRLVAGGSVLIVGVLTLSVLSGYTPWSATRPNDTAPPFLDADSGPPADSPGNVAASLRRVAQLKPGEELTGLGLRQVCYDLLHEGARRLGQHSDYTCRFYRQERVDGELLEPNDVILSVRHEPFSATMYWPETGQHVVWVEGQNGGRMLVNVGGGSWFLSRLKIDPRGDTAMEETRYPITDVGLLKLARRVLKYRRRDLALPGGMTWHLRAGEQIDGHDCYRFTLEYADPRIEPVYRKTVLHLDRETLLPRSIRNFGWGRDIPGAGPGNRDDETLLEHDTYKDIRFDQGLSDEHFSLTNPPSVEESTDE